MRVAVDRKSSMNHAKTSPGAPAWPGYTTLVADASGIVRRVDPGAPTDPDADALLGHGLDQLLPPGVIPDELRRCGRWRGPLCLARPAGRPRAWLCTLIAVHGGGGELEQIAGVLEPMPRVDRETASGSATDGNQESTAAAPDAQAAALAVIPHDPTAAALSLLGLLGDDSADAVLAAWLDDLTLVYANTAAHLMLGLDPACASLVGRAAHCFWGARELERLEGLDPRRVHGWTGEMRQRRADGTGFTARTSLCVTSGGGGMPRLFVAVIHQPGERTRLAADLRLGQFAVERSADAVYLVACEGSQRFRYVNEAACQALGYSREELLSLEIPDIDPEARVDLPDLVASLQRSDGRLVVQRRHRRKDGSTFPVEIVANRIVIDGQAHSCSFVRDITARLAAEAAVEASRQRLHDLVEAVPDALFATDTEHRIIAWNRAIERMTGIGKDQVLGRSDRACARALYGQDTALLLDLVFQDSPEIRCRYDFVLQEGEVFLAERHLPMAYGGRGAYIWAKAVPLRDAAGRMQGALEIIRDITDRKESEQALLLSEARFRSVVSNTPAIIFEGDGEGIFRLCEGQGLRALGLEPGALVGSRVADLFAPESGVQGHWRRASAGASVRFTARIGTRTFETHLNPVVDPGTAGVSVIGVASDLTERIEREAELQQKTDELTRFTYTVSHDLKSPLVTISTFLGFLDQDLRQQDAERIAKDMGFIRNAAQQMTRLLDELLELSRIGRVVNPPTTFGLRELVQQARDLVAGRLVTGAVELEVTGRPVSILGDRPRLLEVFQNLLDNAVKFMGDQPRPLIRVAAEQVGADLVITVADNGGGIDPRHAHKIFDLFEQLETHAEGTGIGLTLVKRIIEVHGGRIWVESAGAGAGVGARFCVVLPGARWADRTRV